ncbi:MAG TPA: AAA family ATPase [Streptosporangiaceae bacterium]|nr:AAA family ATPase [Streptosporangiaceae bacterium]
MATGSDHTRLIVLRGNSGSGKSSVAAALRAAYGRGLAWVSQDLLRRNILREWDRPGAVNIGLIDLTARYCLDSAYHVVMDGIFCADRYEPMLARLRDDHRGLSRFYYFDISLDETLRRHATRPQAADFGPAEMTEWYQPRNLLSSVAEEVVGESSTLQQTTDRILSQTRLLAAPAVPPLRRGPAHPATAHPATAGQASRDPATAAPAAATTAIPTTARPAIAGPGAAATPDTAGQTTADPAADAAPATAGPAAGAAPASA